MLLSILAFRGLIFAFELVSSVESICTDEKIVCYCGDSHRTVTISCIDHDEHEDPCEMYEHCETCEDYVTHCITCPRGHSGPFCDHGNSGWWHDDSHSFHNDRTGSHVVPRDLTCPDLRAPKLGSFRCWYQGYEKECTAQCLPGHSFETGVTEMKLTCESGVWLPRASFPPCLSQGYCKFEIIGGGYYNCTTGIRGTTCDITCRGRGYRPIFGRFYCYPGASWDPPLPYCAKETAVEGSSRDRTPNCECQNGGSCNPRNRRCICPPGYQGTLCETREHDTGLQCQRPAQIDNGEVTNTDGSIIKRNQQFYEGSAVVYSCHAEYGLEGKSLLTCTSYGVWSDLPPRCTSLNTPKTEFSPNEVRNCPDPGQVTNGVRRNLNERQVPRKRNYFIASRVIFSCNDGFALIGETMLICTSSGEWSSPLPVCHRIGSPTTDSTNIGLSYCKDPGVDSNGIKRVAPGINPRKPNRNTKEVEYPQGTEIEYSCKEGYDLEGENSLLCLFSGLWSSSVPFCRAKATSVSTTEDDLVYCNDPGVDPNGIKTVSIWVDARRTTSASGETEYPQGTKINYSCKDGYELDGELAIVCLFSGYWSSPTPKCRAKISASIRQAYCENPGEIINGWKNVLPFVDPRTNRNVLQDSDDFPPGAELVFYCNTGFSVRGNRIIKCTETGTWSSAAPTCENESSRQLQGCGRSDFALTGKILHGENTVQGEWPWQVAYAENRRLGMTITCGASLISHSAAVTAAHCIIQRRLDKTFLYFGKYYSDFRKDDNEVLSRKATEFIVHPRYNRRTMDNDIAIVRFSPDVPYNSRIRPICLPSSETTSQNLQLGIKGWVTGWGTTENGTDSDILLMAQLPYVPTGQCQDTYRRENVAVKITNNMFCAGYAEGGTDSCTGDSGGPLVFYDSTTESYVLEGIVSFGVKGPTGSCGQRNRYGVYTKVSNYVTWINQYT